MKLRDNGENGTPAPGRDAAGGRRKLWELDPAFHCSVVGICLEIPELRRLARKLRVGGEGAGDHALHRALVAMAGTDTAACRRLHRFLDRKYRGMLRRFAGAGTPARVEALWREALAGGEMAAAYWALLTHPATPPGLAERIHGEVHMLSHRSPAALRRSRETLRRTRALARTLTARLEEHRAVARGRVRELEAAVRRLRGEKAALGEELERLRQRPPAAEPVPAARGLQARVRELENDLAAMRRAADRAREDVLSWQRLAAASGDRAMRLEARLAALESERDALEQAMARLLEAGGTPCASAGQCGGRPDLCGRCILYVGGRSRQCGRFRALVEGHNGRFLHHDGGMHEGRARLGALLPQADVVLCPLDCVSHDAARRIKRYCKRYGKRLILLPRSSLAAFAQGLDQVMAQLGPGTAGGTEAEPGAGSPRGA